MTLAALALDLGSTSIKAGLLDRAGNLLHVEARAVPPLHIDGTRYESDALAYAEMAEQVLAGCVAQSAALPPLGICCQRSSFLLWECAGGKPVTPLISWQDGRGAASCAELQAQEARIGELSGLRLAPYFFAPKLRVLLHQHPGWRDKLLGGAWKAGTLDSFLIWRWTGGAQHITDVSMAARTLLLDIHAQQWSPELCALFGIPLSILPHVRPSTGLQLKLQNGLTLQASVADQSAALLASVGESSEIALVNLGTGGFVIRHVAPAQTLPAGYLRTLVYRAAGQPPLFALEGTLNSIAAALAPYPVAECQPEQLGQIPDIYCLAEPSGIGAPYFRKDIGLLFSAPVEHLEPRQIAVLLLEGILFRVARILEEFNRVAPLKQVYLSGGLSEVPCIQQGLAQCLPWAVYRLQQHEASLQGAAMLAGNVAPGAAETIPVHPVANPMLQAKFRRWSHWLDGEL